MVLFLFPHQILILLTNIHDLQALLQQFQTSPQAIQQDHISCSSLQGEHSVPTWHGENLTTALKEQILSQHTPFFFNFSKDFIFTSQSISKDSKKGDLQII